MSPLPAYVQRFFTERLLSQLHASPNTIASYRDTFRLLLGFICERLQKEPTKLLVADLDVEIVSQFLMFVEESRGNSTRSRNTRLAAIRSFFRYIAVNEPQLLHHCQRVLSIPSKRHEKRMIDYLTKTEAEALLAAPDLTRWSGRGDCALLMLAVQTGLRVTELISLKISDISLDTGAHVRCLGKGRKERSTPLRKECVVVLREWLNERNSPHHAPAFVSHRGTALSRDTVERLVKKHATTAARQCPSLASKNVTPHVLRHTTAMSLLQSGVDRTVIALWLGHESVESTQIYLHADLEMKERALASTQSIDLPAGRYQPPDDLMAFLESL